MPLDVSQVRALTAEARKHFKAIPTRAYSIIDRQTSAERRRHIWQNITGLLEENTRTHLVARDSNRLVIQMAQLRDYASFVQNRGRNEIAQKRDRAALELDYYFDSSAMLLASK